MELPHWLMASGAVPLVVGLVGSAFRRNTGVTSNTGRWEGDQPAEVQMPPNPPSKPPYHELNLAIGERTPVFHDRHVEHQIMALTPAFVSIGALSRISTSPISIKMRRSS